MDKFFEILKSAENKVFYMIAKSDEKMPYIVYSDYSERYNKTDNKIEDVVKNVQVDYYTSTPFDPKVDNLRNILDNAGVVFSYKMLYDNAERTYRHTFDCEVLLDAV